MGTPTKRPSPTKGAPSRGKKQKGTTLNSESQTSTSTSSPPHRSRQRRRSSPKEDHANSFQPNGIRLREQSLTTLRELASKAGLQNYEQLTKPDLINALLRQQAEKRNQQERHGLLEIMNEGGNGHGFLRAEKFLPSANDSYVSAGLIRRFDLRTGDHISGLVRAQRENDRSPGLVHIETVNGRPLSELNQRTRFEQLTPIFPDQRFNLETNPRILSTRLLNLIAPIGRGQRGLIVSPSKAGKTTVLKEIANAIRNNYPDVHLMTALIGERPEEVTDMERSVDAEVFASTFDDPVQHHVRVAEMALARAKRLVEYEQHVVLLLDSITRLARAYNLVVPTSGRTLSGGLDPSAIHPPKRHFGAARNVEEGGSLTIVATCLIQTGSKMDDVIYEEFKGTGNMELILSRKLQERRVFPAFDIEQSATRREELLLGPDVLQRVYTLRHMWSHLAESPENGGPVEASMQLLNQLRQTDSNEEFLNTLHT